MPARNIVTNGIPISKVRYSKLPNDDDGYIDLQVWVRLITIFVFALHLVFVLQIHDFIALVLLS